MTFKTPDEALRYCDRFNSCQGVAEKEGFYFAVEQLSKDECE